MANLKQTGVRISQYQIAQVNDNDKKNKLLLNHNFITYAPSYFGTSTMNKNYQIPVQSLRDDFKGYVGVENAKGDWQNTIRFWSGNWSDTYENRENSYVYQWKYDERGNLDYIANKWGNEEDVDKVFLINNAPIPFEEPEQDPCPESNKFVNKKYIDDRFNGIRKITVTGETLAIRPYSCVYEYDTTPTTINIVDTEKLQDGRTVAECIEGNILTFIIKFPANTDVLAIKANGEHNVKWSYPTEFQDIVKAAKENNNSDVWLQCYVGYTEDGLSIRCSSALHPMPGSHEPPKVTDKVTDGDTKVPTSDAVYDFVKEELKPKLEEVVAGDTFIEVKNKNEVFVNTSTDITNDATTVPTTKAVYDSIEELIVSEEYDEIIFDLGNIFYEQINKPWVESMVILSRDNYVYPGSTFTILRDTLHIPHAEKHYPNPGTLTITGISKSPNPATPTITASGFELSDVAKNAISERLKYVAKKYSQDSLTLEIARLQQSVPRKAQWVQDAKNGSLKTALAFTIDDPHTTEILRMFFYYLDQENGRTWGADDSYSKKYMMPGLTFKCLSNTPSGFLHPSSVLSNEYSYTYRTWLGKGNSDKNLISWNSITPNYINYFDWSNYIPFNGEDAFHLSNCWDLLVNKSSFDVFINEIQTDMESLIVSDQYNEFVFDLSNIFYEQINKKWCELMVILSENVMTIPYKEKYYTNVGTLKISGITAGSNPASPSVTTTGFELESFVIDAIRRKLMNVAETGNQTDLNNVIANYQNDIPYKAAWVRDAKAKNIPTQLAFRHSSFYTNEIMRMFFYYLDQENGKTWGAEDSYSKKFMVPGLTYKCLTNPNNEFCKEGDEDYYYSYTYNIWLGDRGRGGTLVNWDFTPSYLAIGGYTNDNFMIPDNWDTLVNEQSWDSFLVDYTNKVKNNSEPHIANKEIHLTPEEKAQLFKTKFVITSKPDLTGSQSTGSVGGFVLEPTSDVKADKIVMKGISNLVSNILYIWKDTADGIVTVLQNPTKSIVDGTTHTWNFNETLTFNANERYYFTWHNAVNSGAIAPPARGERGHTPSVQKYSHVQGQIFALKTTQFFSAADVDRNNTVDCTFYIIDGVETVSPSTESVELKINSHASDTVKHITADERTTWNTITTHASDTVQHITADERTKWNTITTHASDTVQHITADERSSWNTHPTNTVQHITADERTTWNSITTHASDETKHFIGDEKSMLLKDRLDIMEKSNISGTQASENIAGIAIEPTSTFTTDRIVMSGITDLPSCVLYIWKNTDTGVITVHQTPNANKSIIEGDTHTWNLGEVVTFEENNTYFITWQAQQNSNAWAPPATAEQGYVKSTKKYASQTGEHIFVLKVAEVGYNQPRHFGVDQIDRNYTIDCTFYLKNGKEPVAPSPESVQNIVNDLKTIKSELTALQNTVKHDIEFVQETMSFGESNMNQNSNSNCYGITFIAQENATIDTLTIKTANSGYFSKVENLYAIIHEEQEDGTKKEIASMETPVNLSSSNTQYKLTFYPFAIAKDKKYFVEFIQKNTETGSFNDTRTMVNLGLLNDTSASGVLSQSSRSSWSVNYANQYSPIMKLSQEMFIMGNLALSNDMQYPLSLVAKMNGEDATNIVLLKPFVTASTDINIESVTNGHVLGIILEKNENTVAGEHYLGIKTLYINKETNEMKEVLLHSPLTIIE